MFQFRRFPTYAYLIQRRLTEYCSAGFPHSVICGSKLMCSSPQLIAACHDLHRLLMPRHSPCALISLTFVGVDFISLASPLRRKLAHSIAPPPQFEPASLGFKLVPAGSLRIMQASVWFHCSFCTLYLKSPQNYFVTSLLLARNFLLASLFSFQGACSNLLQGQIEMLGLLTKHFNLISLVEVTGLEPVTPCLQSRCSTS